MPMTKIKDLTEVEPTQSVTKRNAPLFHAFEMLARSLGLAVRSDMTEEHEYDSLAVGNRPLKNALSVWHDRVTFFTADQSLYDELKFAGLDVAEDRFSKDSPHNQYRYIVRNLTPSSLKEHTKLFARLVRDAVAYVENPIAGHHTKGS